MHIRSSMIGYSTMSATRTRAIDVALCSALFAGTVWYVWRWPRDLYPFDEGLFLYGAKRILDGQVMYRDFFEILTPASFYVTAALFAVFGVTMETARLGSAALHGLIAVGVYAACYLACERRLVAALAGVLHAALCYRAMTLASPHWYSTLLMVLLAVALLRWPRLTFCRAALVGALGGLMIITQQQKGVILAVAPMVVIALRHLFDRRAGVTPPLAPLRQLGAYGVGLALVVVPVMLAFVVAAGPTAVLDALVLHPIRNYPRVHQVVPWGKLPWGIDVWPLLETGNWLLAGVVVPLRLVAYLPFLIAVGAVRLGRHAWRRTPPPQRLLAPTVLSAAAVVAVSYNPNYAHLGTVAQVWLVLAAEAIGALRRHLAGRPLVRAAGYACAGLAMIVAAWQLERNIGHESRLFPLPHQTIFGRVDFASKGDIRFVDTLQGLVTEEGVEEIFVYPCAASLYLLTGTSNPSRFQILLPLYSTREQVEEVVRVLEARAVRFVVQNMYWNITALEPLGTYLREHYEQVPVQREGGLRYVLLRRKA